MIGQFIGPYKILEPLGKGGMGLVYLGMHAKLEQRVAIKVLSPEFCRNASMRSRFEREAKLQAKLSHPNVVKILNFLEDEQNIYLVMEFVRGETLAKRLQKGRLDLSECQKIALEVLEALRFMHRQGMVHRDVKPSNIILTDDGHIKVTDFGIAKTPDSESLTKTGVQVGTVWYMSPEQIRGQHVDAAADIYALGVTLYQMVTGQVPFNSESEFEIMRAHVEKNPPLPIHLNPDIPQELNRIILKALAKNPDERIRSAELFIEALQNLNLTDAGIDQAFPANTSPEAPLDKGTFRKKIRKSDNLFNLKAFSLSRNTLYLLMAAGLLLVFLLIVLWWFAENRKTNVKLPLTEKPPVSDQVQAQKKSPMPKKKSPALPESETSPRSLPEKAAVDTAPTQRPPAKTQQLPPELMPSADEIGDELTQEAPAQPQKETVDEIAGTAHEKTPDQSQRNNREQTADETHEKTPAEPQQKKGTNHFQAPSGGIKQPTKMAERIPRNDAQSPKKTSENRGNPGDSMPKKTQQNPGDNPKPKTGGNRGWVIIK